jgi:hypothetical protein
MRVQWRKEGIESGQTRAIRSGEQALLGGLARVLDGHFVYAESTECKKTKRC